jgi:hypothetical protein
MDFPSLSSDSTFFTNSRSFTTSEYQARSRLFGCSSRSFGLRSFILACLTPLLDAATKLAR